jgi:hypothetical protein
MPSRAAVLKVHEPGSPGRPGFRRSIWGCLLVRHRGTGAYLACRELAFHPLQGTPHRSSAIHPDLRTSRHREEPKEQIWGEAARAWSDIIGTRQLPGPVPAPCGRDDCGLWVSHRSPGLACCLPVSEKTASYYIQKGCPGLFRPPVCRTAWLVLVVGFCCWDGYNINPSGRLLRSYLKVSVIPEKQPMASA